MNTPCRATDTEAPIELLTLNLDGPNPLEFLARSVRAIVSPLGVNGDDAALVAYELAANAVQHGLPPARLTVQRLSNRLHVEVTDSRRCALPHRARVPNDESGRGLLLARALSDRFSWGLRDGLKYVQASFELPAIPTPQTPMFPWRRATSAPRRPDIGAKQS